MNSIILTLDTGIQTSRKSYELVTNFSIRRLRNGVSLTLYPDQEMSLCDSLQIDLNATITLEEGSSLAIYGG